MGKDMPAGGGRGQNLRKGLSARVDTPRADETLPLTRILISGWVVHRDRYVRGVLIEVDGEVAAVAPLGVERVDVLEGHPGQADTPLVGWATTVDLSEHESEFVTLSA